MAKRKPRKGKTVSSKSVMRGSNNALKIKRLEALFMQLLTECRAQFQAVKDEMEMETTVLSVIARGAAGEDLTDEEKAALREFVKRCNGEAEQCSTGSTESASETLSATGS